MNGQFSQIFVTASSVRQPLNYSELFSLLLYCTETQAASRSFFFAGGSPAPIEEGKKIAIIITSQDYLDSLV